MTKVHQILGGWRSDPREVARTLSQMPRPLFALAAPALSGSGINRTVLLYKALKEVNGEVYPEYPAQTIGDCVSQAFGHGVDLLEAVQIIVEQRPEVWTPTATEAIYGMARVDIGGLVGVLEDGAVGAWGAKAVSTLGTLSRNLLGPYDGRRAKEWGARGVPQIFAEKASTHKVQTASLIATYDQLEDALANGYPVAVCSPPGFTLVRDTEGFCLPQGNWFHAMLIVGVRADSRPGACFLQSWGPNIPSGPLAHDQPSNSFWVERTIVQEMLAAGDSWSISGFNGYPRQPLPESWSYDGFA